jgi:hypothetical protein
MPLNVINFDLDAPIRHLEAIAPNWPSSIDRFERTARARAREIFAQFCRSPEAKGLYTEPRWPILVMRTACTDHHLTIDDLTAEIFEKVTRVFFPTENIAAYAHWTGVVQDELVAFFRFLERQGFKHAAACLQVLERIGPQHEARFSELNLESVTEITEEQAARFMLQPGCISLPPCSQPPGRS